MIVFTISSMVTGNKSEPHKQVIGGKCLRIHDEQI